MHCSATAAKTPASSDCGCTSFYGVEPRPGGTVAHCLSIYNPLACLPDSALGRRDAICQNILYPCRGLFGLKRLGWNYKISTGLIAASSIGLIAASTRATSGLADFLQTILITVLYNYMDVTDVLNLQRFRRLHVLSFQSNFEKISIYIGYILYIEKSPNISFPIGFNY